RLKSQTPDSKGVWLFYIRPLLFRRITRRSVGGRRGPRGAARGSFRSRGAAPGGGLGRCGACFHLRRALGLSLRSRLGGSLAGRLGNRFGKDRRAGCSGRRRCWLPGTGRFRRGSRLGAELLDRAAQFRYLVGQGLQLVLTRQTQPLDGAGYALVEHFFQATELVGQLAARLVHLGPGTFQRVFFLALTLGSAGLGLGRLLSLLAILDQRLEQLGAFLAHAGVGSKSGQPDLSGIAFQPLYPLGVPAFALLLFRHE